MASFQTNSLIKVTLGLLALSVLCRATYYTLSEGFSLQRISAPLPQDPKLATPRPSSAVLTALSAITQQPFLYLKKGSQAYAFVSEDKQFVLKLFKLHHMQPAEWMLSLPCPPFLRSYRDSLVHRRRHRITLTLSSYVIAATQLNEECALLYAQVLPSTGFSLPVTIVDALGRRYIVDLAQHGFAIQYRADLVLTALSNWIQQGQLDSARHAIDSLVSLIVQRSAKGFQDSDPDLHKNAGIIATTAVHIDIGSFFKNPKISSLEETKRDLRKIFSKLLPWLSARSPELYTHLLNRLEAPESLSWRPSCTPTGFCIEAKVPSREV